MGDLLQEGVSHRISPEEGSDEGIIRRRTRIPKPPSRIERFYHLTLLSIIIAFQGLVLLYLNLEKRFRRKKKKERV